VSADATRAYVRLTEPAADDLRILDKRDPQIVRWCLQKMLLLERSPLAGEPLVGGLIGYRKLTVSNRDWRIVWRVVTDDLAHVTIDVAEVWAAGARADGEVYAEMQARLATLGSSPKAAPLHEVLESMGRLFSDIDATPEPVAPDPVPAWLRNLLTETVGLSEDEVDAMTPEQATEIVQAHWSTRRD
jgi:mRNA interferase RelE/StbE